MADLYEVLITAELPAGLPEPEMAELRWHLGLGPQPEDLSIVTDGLPLVTVGEDGEPLSEDRWEVQAYPLLAERGAADRRIGGVVFSELAHREEPADPGWALSSRQVIHGDDLDLLAPLLRWLWARAVGRRGGPACVSCHMRFHEDDLVLRPVSVGEEGFVIHEGPQNLP